MSTDQSISIWHLLWQMIRYAPRLYALDTLFWLFIMGLPILPGIIIREFFNQLSGESQLDWSGEVLIGLLLAGGLGRIIAIILGRITKTQHRFLMSGLVRRNLFAQLLKQPGAEPFSVHDTAQETTSTGEIISYFREDAHQIENNVVATNEILGEGVFAGIALIILLNVNARLTLLVVLPIIAIAFVIQQAEKRLKQYHRRSRHATQNVTGFIGETFSSVQAIQVAGAEDSILNHFRDLNNQRHRQMVRDQVFSTAIDSLLENLTTVGTGLILLVAAIAITQGAEPLTVGDFALFVYYLVLVTDFLWFLGTFLALSKQTEVALERITSLLKPNYSSQDHSIVQHHSLYLPTIGGRKPTLPNINPSTDCPQLEALTIRGLSYQYPSSNTLCAQSDNLPGIFDINLTLEKGSFTVITGRIGAGKTTLLQVLLGLRAMQKGTIEWNGELIHDPASFFVPPRSAYTPQVPHLFSNTLKENILMGWDENFLDAAIYSAVFEQDLASMPHGLETVIGTKGVRLSGGQMQRAAATRMFVRRPELIVCDDLSSALDVETEHQLWSRLLATRHDCEWNPTCLVVSHRPSVLRQADQVMILEDGRSLEVKG